MSDGDVTFVLAGYLAAMALGGLLGALLVTVRGGQQAAARDWSTGYEGRPVARWSDEPTELDLDRPAGAILCDGQVRFEGRVNRRLNP